MDNNKWLISLSGNGENLNKPIVVCFHGAGGSCSAFIRWRKKISQKFDLLLIQLPGRDERSDEPFCNDFAEAGERLLPLLSQQLKDQRFIVVGHSMGGILARQLCQRLTKLNQSPSHLVTVASFSPDYVVEAIAYLHDQSDAQLEETFTDFANIPASPIKQNLLKILRADLRFLSTHINSADKIGCDLTVFSGHEDSYVTTALTRRWRNQKGQSQLTEFDITGSHTNIITQPEVIDYVNECAMRLV